MPSTTSIGSFRQRSFYFQRFQDCCKQHFNMFTEQTVKSYSGTTSNSRSRIDIVVRISECNLLDLIQRYSLFSRMEHKSGAKHLYFIYALFSVRCYEQIKECLVDRVI